MKRTNKINNIVVISDIHAGCQLGLCPPGAIKLDNSGHYHASKFQRASWKAWMEWWEESVPMLTREEDYIIVVNGDMVEGRHHQATTTISNNLSIHSKIARKIMEPILLKKKCKGYYHIRGTEAHVGLSAENEEKLAENLEAMQDEETRNYSRWEMWTRLDKALIHFTHHVGTTSSSSYESTAVFKELVEAYNEAGRWKDEPPDVVVRSHRHRAIYIGLPAGKGMGLSCVTPGWQLKTPFVYKQALGKASTPHVGGCVIRTGDEDEVYVRYRTWKMKRPKEVVL